jgi:hypothetical protein
MLPNGMYNIIKPKTIFPSTPFTTMLSNGVDESFLYLTNEMEYSILSAEHSVQRTVKWMKNYKAFYPVLKNMR